MHPLLALIATRPQLLTAHAEAYAALAAAEFCEASTGWQRRLMFGAAALCSAGVAAVLAGAALMLWAVILPTADLARVVLIATPVLPALIALVCGLAARGDGRASFAALRQQVKADLHMLREAGSR
jgi:hypothetical protein